MQYKVPQDVQREDTIIGPVTLKQMGILGIGGALAYGTYISLAKTYFIEIWLPPVAIISLITLAFAFLKLYSMPFHEFLMNVIEYNVLAKKRIWIQGTGTPFIPPFDEVAAKKEEDAAKKEVAPVKKIEDLGQLSKILDSHGASKLDELSEREKKEKLAKLIQQNYQKS